MPRNSKNALRAEPDDPASHVGAARPPGWLAVAILATSVALVYGRSLDVPFIFDDLTTISGNPSLTSLWPLIGTVDHPGPLNPDQQLPTAARPLVNFSFAVNYYFGAVNPAGYHAGNVAIHFLSALLVWAIIRRTLQLAYFAGRFDSSAGWLALAAAMLWALHPLQTETVIYATQRTELMFAFFYLATLYCSLRYWSATPLPFREGQGEGSPPTSNRRAHAIWLTLAVLGCLAGMASKEVMVSAPLMVLLFERAFVAGSLATALRRSWPLYIGLASTWLQLFGLLCGAPHSESAGFGLCVAGYVWWLTQAKVLWIYLKLVVWPWPLLIHYEFPYFETLGESWMYVVPTLLLVVATLVLLWRNNPLGYLGTWIFAILSPTLIIPIITEIAAERRMYLPLVALVVPFVVGSYLLTQKVLDLRARNRQNVSTLSYPHLVIFVPLFALAILLGLVSVSRLGAYYDEKNLWRAVLQVYPEDEVALYNLGCAFMASQQLPEAIDTFQAGLALKPNDVDVLNNLGVALLRSKRHQEGITILRRAVLLQPDSSDVHVNLGLLLTRVGQHAEAVEQLRAGLALNPSNTNALATLGLSLVLLGRYPEAIETLQRAARLQPDNTEVLNHLGSAFARSGKDPLAIDQYRQTLRVDPNNLEAHYNLGLLLTAENTEEAASHFEHIIRLQPNVADFHNSFGDLLRKSGRIQEAIQQYEAAVRAQPGFLAAYASLVQILAAANRSTEAIATAEKAIEVARSTHQEAGAESIEEWLKHYQTELQRSNDAKTNSQLQPSSK